MLYRFNFPSSPTFTGEGLIGYACQPPQSKDLDIYYVEVQKGHDTFMISRKITRIYYILDGEGYFTIANRRYDVTPGMLVEVPPKREYSYSGNMKLIIIGRPHWFEGNDTHTKKNPDVFGEESKGSVFLRILMKVKKVLLIMRFGRSAF
jgi:hypothetical protein